MLFNITFLLFTILGRASATNKTSQNLILYNETRIVDERNLRFKRLRKFINTKNLGKVLKVAGTSIKIGGTIHPGLKGISAGISVAQKLLAARAKLKKLKALKKTAKSFNNIKKLNLKIKKVKSLIKNDKKIIAKTKTSPTKRAPNKTPTTKRAPNKRAPNNRAPNKTAPNKKASTKRASNKRASNNTKPNKRASNNTKPNKKVTTKKVTTKRASNKRASNNTKPNKMAPNKVTSTKGKKRAPTKRHQIRGKVIYEDTSVPTESPTYSPNELLPTKIKINHPRATDDFVPLYISKQKQRTSTTDDSIRSPTFIPRLRRTEEPNISDDLNPTPRPRIRQTKRPTPRPYITDDWTFKPSISKINAQIITLWPSHKPSLLSAKASSLKPSSVPSLKPSSVPSPMPSQKPSPMPSQKPSPMPSQKPSSIPSQKPSPMPSQKPSPIPSSNPTPVPTDYIPCNKNCPVKPDLCGFYETCGNGCWCGRFPPTPSNFPTFAPTQNLFTINPPTMLPYVGAVLNTPSPMPALQPSTQSPTTFLPTTISPTSLRPTLKPSVSPTLEPVTQSNSPSTHLPSYLTTLFPTSIPTSEQTNTILSSNGASNNSLPSNTIVIGAVVGGVVILLIAIIVIFCIIRKNRKLDAFTKWRLHYDSKIPIRRDTTATIENDIHHFYKKNTSVNTREFTPYVSKNQRGSQRSSLRPQSMNLPMTEYNRNSTRL